MGKLSDKMTSVLGDSTTLIMTQKGVKDAVENIQPPAPAGFNPDNAITSAEEVLAWLSAHGNLRNAHINEAYFTYTDFSGVDFSGTVFTDVIFIDCDIATAIFMNCQFRTSPGGMYEDNYFAAVTPNFSNWAGAYITGVMNTDRTSLDTTYFNQPVNDSSIASARFRGWGPNGSNADVAWYYYYENAWNTGPFYQ